jgi:hypothetical protein
VLSSNPIAAMASKLVFRAFLAIGAAFCAGRSFVSFGVLLRRGEFSASALRLTTLRLRGVGRLGDPSAITGNAGGMLNASESAAAIGIQQVGLLWNGCAVTAPAACSGSEATQPWRTAEKVGVDYGREVRANGYYYTTATQGTGALDTVAWIAEVSRKGTAWTAVGASGWRLRFDGRAVLYPGLSFPTPDTRGSRVEFDLRPGWPWALQHVATFALGALCFLSALALALAGQFGSVKWAFVLHYGTAAVLLAVAAAGSSQAGQGPAACALTLLIPEHVLLAAGLAFCERHFISILGLYGTAFFISRAAAARACHEAQWSSELAESALGPGTLALVLALAASLGRRLELWRAHHLVAEDRARYDAAWAKLMLQVDSKRWVPALEAEVARIAMQLSSAIPRQPVSKSLSCRLEVRAKSGALVRWLWKNWAGPFIHLAWGGVGRTSLDQLYCQASCLDPILRVRVRAWAEKSSGESRFGSEPMLPSGSTVSVQLERAAGGSGPMIKWGEVSLNALFFMLKPPAETSVFEPLFYTLSR